MIPCHALTAMTGITGQFWDPLTGDGDTRTRQEADADGGALTFPEIRD